MRRREMKIRIEELERELAGLREHLANLENVNRRLARATKPEGLCCSVCHATGSLAQYGSMYSAFGGGLSGPWFCFECRPRGAFIGAIAAVSG